MLNRLECRRVSGRQPAQRTLFSSQTPGHWPSGPNLPWDGRRDSGKAWRLLLTGADIGTCLTVQCAVYTVPLLLTGTCLTVQCAVYTVPLLLTGTEHWYLSHGTVCCLHGTTATDWYLLTAQCAVYTVPLLLTGTCLTVQCAVYTVPLLLTGTEH